MHQDEVRGGFYEGEYMGSEACLLPETIPWLTPTPTNETSVPELSGGGAQAGENGYPVPVVNHHYYYSGYSSKSVVLGVLFGAALMGTVLAVCSHPTTPPPPPTASAHAETHVPAPAGGDEVGGVPQSTLPPQQASAAPHAPEAPAGGPAAAATAPTRSGWFGSWR